MSASEPPSSKEGFLSKLGAVRQSWKRRFFVLRGGRLRYYASPAEAVRGPGRAKGELVVRGARVLRLEEADFGKPHALAVTPPLCARTYVLVAGSEAEREEWFLALSSHDGVAYAGATKVDPRSLREGFLTKQGGRRPTLKRRYFVLFPHTLLYYEHQGDVRPAGEVPLRAGAEVSLAATPAAAQGLSAFYVAPLLESCGGRRWLLLAASDAERRAWMDAIVGAGGGGGAGAAAEAWDSDDSDGAAAAEEEEPGRNDGNKDKDDDTGTVVAEGWMSKRGAVVRSWRRRFFVLESGARRRVLRYYRAETDEAPLGEIRLLPSSSVAAAAADDDPRAFTVSEADGARQYLVRAPSAEARDLWVRAVRAACRGHRESLAFGESNQDLLARSRSDLSMAGAGAGRVPERRQPLVAAQRAASVAFRVHPRSAAEGWLLKSTRDGRRWDRRYCVAVASGLFYFHAKPTAAQMAAAAPDTTRLELTGAEVAADVGGAAGSASDPRAPHTFFVRPKDAGREYVFGAATREERATWLDALGESVRAAGRATRRGGADGALREGFMSHHAAGGRRGGSWRRAYFVLSRRGLLSRHDDGADAPASAVLKVDDAFVRLVDRDRYGRARTFELTGQNGAMILSCDTADDMEAWVDALMLPVADQGGGDGNGGGGDGDGGGGDGYDSDFGEY